MHLPSFSRPKTAPTPVVDKKPPRTPDKKSATITGTKPGGSADDWLTELTAKVDDETDAALPTQRRTLSRQSRYWLQYSIIQCDVYLLSRVNRFLYVKNAVWKINLFFGRYFSLYSYHFFMVA